MFYISLCILVLLILVGIYFIFFNQQKNSNNKENINENIESNQLENNNNIIEETEVKYTKNYSSETKIAYQNENDKENSTFVYLNENNKTDYKWNDYIFENKIILTTMPDIDFTQFEELEENFYTLKITDSKIYNEFAEKYNFKKLNESDFDNIFAQIIVMKDTDSLIKYGDVIRGEEFIADGNVNYTLPVSKGGIIDTSEPFKSSCIQLIFHALNTAKTYLKNLKYKGCTNFSYLNYIRVVKV